MKHLFKAKNFSATFTDENGYFSFTGTTSGVSGAVGERIVEIEPVFQALELLHLCDVETGAPMHAWANAEYFARQEQNGAVCGALHLDIEDKRELFLVQSFINELLHGTPEALEEIKADVAEIWLDRVECLEDALEELLDEYAPENRPEFVEPYNEETGDVLPIYADIDEDELDRRAALARFLNCNINDVEPVRYSETEFEAEGNDWLVLTEDEADEMARESVRSYIDDCLEIPENIRPYFDEDRYIDDVLRADGRGHVLSSWDGSENEEQGLDNLFFIYRR